MACVQVRILWRYACTETPMSVPTILWEGDGLPAMWIPHVPMRDTSGELHQVRSMALPRFPGMLVCSSLVCLDFFEPRAPHLLPALFVRGGMHDAPVSAHGPARV